MGVVYVDQVKSLKQLDDSHFEINPAFLNRAQRLQVGDRLQIFGFDDREQARMFSENVGSTLSEEYGNAYSTSSHPISGLFFPPCVSIVRR